MFVRLRRLAALLAVLAFIPALPARAATPELPDRIAAAWRNDRVYVDDRLRPIPELDRVRAEAAAADFAVYVALLPRTPYTREKVSDLVTLLHARVGEPGLYVVATVSDSYWSATEELYRPAGLKGRSLTRVQLDDEQHRDIVNDRPAPMIVRSIQQAATAYDGRPLPPIPAGDLEPERAPPGRSATDLEDLSAFTGLGAGALAGFALTLWLVLRRRSGSGRSKPKAGDGEPMTVGRMQVRADEWIERAQRSLDRLDKRRGKSVKVMDQREDAYRRLDAARTLRDGDPDDLLSVTGAFVLARQAERGASGAKISPPCFFDPTHRSGTMPVTWADDVEVPACQACARLVGKGTTPNGLQVWRRSGLLGREHVPYWTLDPEDNVMVATGFGALSDDLPDRVARLQDGAR
ncbi:hypothetical protein E1218_23500 [Kribbella turkmenica]|uniref:TPM domain-containing protein n=1 Tax=Kribbella turkmenica TaxID=2530375 RepID=A0A4R4WMD8_9ACTN|nr:hypothetical protein [Kribbella turkmenica]TDD19731.1 hypothetical protein E1218_23500 [Kribbella turkmenica]